MPVKFQKGVDLNGQRAINAGDATAGTDLVTLQQVQAFLAGLRWKAQGVKAASTGNISLASLVNGVSLDGVTLATGDRALLKNQTAAAENGIYVVPASGAPSRATDADTTAELENAAVFVSDGTINADKAFTQTATVTTVGTTAQVWAPFGAGSTYTAGNGLVLSGNSFAVLLDAASGLIVTANGLKIDPSVVARSYAADCAATTNPQTFTHGLGTNDIVVAVYTAAGVLVQPDISKGSGTVIVDWGSAPAAGDYRIVVKG